MGPGGLIGWISTALAIKEAAGPRGGKQYKERVVADAARCAPATSFPFIFLLWLLQFMLPAVILVRIFYDRTLTLRAANTQAVLLLGSVFGSTQLIRITPGSIELERNGRLEQQIPLGQISGLGITETWMTQSIVIECPRLNNGCLRLWVESPAALAATIQQAAGKAEGARQ